MHFCDLPRPAERLQALENAIVVPNVTLSCFIGLNL